MIGRRRVAGGTIRIANHHMVKKGVAEIGGVAVTEGTCAAVMIVRRRMANGAIRTANQSVVEDSIFEIGGIGVAAAAQSFVVIGWGSMTFRTIGIADIAVIEVDIFPVGDVVAGGAVGAVGAGVGVIILMAGQTGGVSSPVIAGLMAGFTG